MLVFWSPLCSWSVKLNLLSHLLFFWFKNARELILVRAINYYSTKRNYPITILPYGKRIQNYFNNLTSTYCSILTFLFALRCTNYNMHTNFTSNSCGCRCIWRHSIIMFSQNYQNLEPPTIPPCSHLFDFGNPPPPSLPLKTLKSLHQTPFTYTRTTTQ